MVQPPLGSTLPSPLLPAAYQLRYCTTFVIVAAAAVAAFLWRPLSLGLNPKDGFRALPSPVLPPRAPTVAAVVAAAATVVVYPALFLEFNSGDMRVFIFLHRDR